ncbi:MAG: DUF2857 domain-containing protein [Thioalkalivibrio sp.]
MVTTTADMSFQVLRYAMERVQDGDLTAAMDLGFTIEEIRELEALSIKDLSYLSRLGGHFLRLEINHEIYRAMLKRVREEAASEALQDALLAHGAPRALMTRLYGWSAGHYALRRKILGLANSCGRPPQPTPEQETCAWTTWSRHDHIPLPERYLLTAQAAGIGISTLCNLLPHGTTDSTQHDASQVVSVRVSKGA